MALPDAEATVEGVCADATPEIRRTARTNGRNVTDELDVTPWLPPILSSKSLLRRRAEPQQARARAFADHRHVTCDAVVADHVRVRITGLPFCQRGELGLRTVLFRVVGDQHIGARLL